MEHKGESAPDKEGRGAAAVMGGREVLYEMRRKKRVCTRIVFLSKQSAWVFFLI